MLNAIASTENMPRNDWLAWRNQGIGGSDVATICGVNKYKSAYQLWVEKTGKYKELQENEYTYWGTVLEPVIRNEFIKRTGLNVITPKVILRHKEYPFMLANIDGIVQTRYGDCIFEAKTSSTYNSEEWTDDSIPYAYRLQIQHYMAVTNLDEAYVAVLIGGNQYKWYCLERDDLLIEMIIDLEQQFWGYVVNDIMPPIDGSEATKNFIHSMFPHCNADETIVLSDKYVSLLESYETNQALEKRYAEQKEQAGNQLKLLNGDKEAAFVSDRLVTWKNVVSQRLDSKRLVNEMPEVYQKYLCKSEYRRFTIR